MLHSIQQVFRCCYPQLFSERTKSCKKYWLLPRTFQHPLYVYHISYVRINYMAKATKRYCGACPVWMWCMNRQRQQGNKAPEWRMFRPANIGTLSTDAPTKMSVKPFNQRFFSFQYSFIDDAQCAADGYKYTMNRWNIKMTNLNAVKKERLQLNFLHKTWPHRIPNNRRTLPHITQSVFGCHSQHFPFYHFKVRNTVLSARCCVPKVHIFSCDFSYTYGKTILLVAGIKFVLMFCFS